MTPKVQRSAAFGPLDEALFNLRRLGLYYRWTVDDLRIWEAVCPCCRTWGLRLREPYRGGPITLICDGGGCDDGAVHWSLTADPLQWRVAELEDRLSGALDLADDARDVAARALELVASTAQPTEVAA